MIQCFQSNIKNLFRTHMIEEELNIQAVPKEEKLKTYKRIIQRLGYFYGMHKLTNLLKDCDAGDELNRLAQRRKGAG